MILTTANQKNINKSESFDFRDVNCDDLKVNGKAELGKMEVEEIKTKGVVADELKVGEEEGTWSGKSYTIKAKYNSIEIGSNDPAIGFFGRDITTDYWGTFNYNGTEIIERVGDMIQAGGVDTGKVNNIGTNLQDEENKVINVGTRSVATIENEDFEEKERPNIVSGIGALQLYGKPLKLGYESNIMINEDLGVIGNDRVTWVQEVPLNRYVKNKINDRLLYATSIGKEVRRKDDYDQTVISIGDHHEEKIKEDEHGNPLYKIQGHVPVYLCGSKVHLGDISNIEIFDCEQHPQHPDTSEKLTKYLARKAGADADTTKAVNFGTNTNAANNTINVGNFDKIGQLYLRGKSIYVNSEQDKLYLAYKEEHPDGVIIKGEDGTYNSLNNVIKYETQDNSEFGTHLINNTDITIGTLRYAVSGRGTKDERRREIGAGSINLVGKEVILGPIDNIYVKDPTGEKDRDNKLIYKEDKLKDFITQSSWSNSLFGTISTNKVTLGSVISATKIEGKVISFDPVQSINIGLDMKQYRPDKGSALLTPTINIGVPVDKKEYMNDTVINGSKIEILAREDVTLDAGIIRLGRQDSKRSRAIWLYTGKKLKSEANEGDTDDEEGYSKISYEEFADVIRGKYIGTRLNKGDSIKIGTEFKNTNENGEEVIENAGDIEMHGDTLTVDGNKVIIGDEHIGDVRIQKKVTLPDGDNVFIGDSRVTLNSLLNDIAGSDGNVRKGKDFGTELVEFSESGMPNVITVGNTKVQCYIRGKQIYVNNGNTTMELAAYIREIARGNNALTVKDDTNAESGETSITPGWVVTENATVNDQFTTNDATITGTLNVETISTDTDDGFVSFKRPLIVQNEGDTGDSNITCVEGGDIDAKNLTLSHKLYAGDGVFDAVSTGYLDSTSDELPIKKKVKFMNPLQDAAMDRDNSYANVSYQVGVMYVADGSASDSIYTTMPSAMTLKFNFNRINEGAVMVTGPLLTAYNSSYFSKITERPTKFRFSTTYSIAGSYNANNGWFPDMVDTRYFVGFEIPFTITMTSNTGKKDNIQGTISYSKTYMEVKVDGLFDKTTSDYYYTEMSFTPGSVVVPLASPNTREEFFRRYLN